MILFIDTETTGKADFRSPPDAPHQPRLVQFGAILTDDDGKEMSSLNLIINTGVEIPQEASGIHGITTKIAEDYGISLEFALPLITRFFLKPRQIVAHNVDFDSLILRGEFLRAMIDEDPFEGADLFCTMRAMTPVCKLPGNYGDYKWPKLQEAYKHAFGVEFEGAHDAMADVRACAKVYFWLKKESALVGEVRNHES
jgi:DNA polymerase III epsilon subunit-like protein